MTSFEELRIAILVDYMETSDKVWILPLYLQSTKHNVGKKNGRKVKSRILSCMLMANYTSLFSLNL